MHGKPEAPPRKTNLVPIVIVLVLALLGSLVVCSGIVVAIALPALQHAREVRRREQAAESLKEIGEALRNYHETMEHDDAFRQELQESFDRAFEKTDAMQRAVEAEAAKAAEAIDAAETKEQGEAKEQAETKEQGEARKAAESTGAAERQPESRQ